MLVASLMAMEADKLTGDHQQQPRRQGMGIPFRHSVTTTKRLHHQDAPSTTTAPASGLSVNAFLVLACVAMLLIVLPLVLPPLPPPPPMLLLVPVCLLLLLAALPTFVPSDTRTMASAYL